MIAITNKSLEFQGAFAGFIKAPICSKEICGSESEDATAVPESFSGQRVMAMRDLPQLPVMDFDWESEADSEEEDAESDATYEACTEGFDGPDVFPSGRVMAVRDLPSMEELFAEDSDCDSDCDSEFDAESEFAYDGDVEEMDDL